MPKKKTPKDQEPVVYDATDPTKPWEKKFDDDRDDSGNLSRVATHKKRRGNTVLRVVLWTLIALLVIVPVTMKVWHANSNPSGGNYTGDKITIESTSKKKPAAKSSASKKPAKKSSSKTAKASSSSKTSTAASSSQAVSSSSASSSQQASSSSTVSSASSSSAASSASSSSASAKGTYTVKTGDNLYRIAVNHGMTLDELLQLNGMSQGASISAGQSLKVK